MNIIKNEKLIERNHKIGRFLSFSALGVLGIGMYISFTQPELLTWAVAALLIGFVMTQTGIYYTNRWGRSPRPDENLDAGLKGLANEFSIYHWATPVSHLLVGPAGLWVLLPYHQRGQVKFQNNRWKMGGGGFLQGYMRIFGQEGIGRPDLEAESEINSLHKALVKVMEEDEIPEINVVLVFTSKDVEIDAEDTPMPALPLKKLKSFIRNKAKEKPITAQDLANVQEFLPT